MSEASAPGWQGILASDERILWQGQPDRRLRIGVGELRRAAPGLFFVAFSLFWMYNAARSSVPFALFGLIFLVIGLRKLVEPLLLPAYLRSRSWYTLTDRRAIVATDTPVQGRRLISYPIDAATPVEMVDGDPPSILFGPDADAGFRFIPEAEHVLGLLRELQRSNAPRPETTDPETQPE
ncbi:hypothetical protein SAMN05421538_10685 [Paracoccus isoporae]|uniref:PH domain-containing protein n=1 Tax=Paracoccus isoporae TaxID=591205 RepID=A0A1G7CFP9_9RHOB|nr:hypothetical protein [Paracoccus isoporae]SDE38214.1 hypothetical protein SAMN05421538_10685 [Paracoccus isoporae]